MRKFAFVALAFLVTVGLLARQLRQAGPARSARTEHYRGPRTVPIATVLGYLKAHQESLGVRAPPEIALLEVARDELGLSAVALPQNGSTFELKDEQLVEGASPYFYRIAVRDRLAQAPWEKPVSEASRAALRANRLLFEQLLELPPEVMAWIRLQLGEAAQVKEELRKAYDAEFRAVMASTAVPFGDLSSSTARAEYFSNALEGLSTMEEKAALAENLQKMKVHVSTLPAISGGG